MQPPGVIIDKSPQKEYTVERLSPERISHLALLHAQVYGKEAEEDYFRKKYNTDHTGAGYVGMIAYGPEGQPIAFYGVIPCFVEYGSQTVLSAQSADTMTHPGYRFKGMFVELSNTVFELCRQMGIRLVFGFPNQNSYHGAVGKLGWKETESLQCFTIPVKTLPLKKLMKVFGQAPYEKYLRSILSKYRTEQLGISNSAIEDGFAGVQRSEAYLHYKTYSRTMVLRIQGAQVWASIREGLIIGDMQGVNEKNASTVVNSLKRLAALAGLRYLQFHFCSGTRLYSLLSEITSPLPSFPVLFQDFGSPVPPENVKFSFADIDIF